MSLSALPFVLTAVGLLHLPFAWYAWRAQPNHDTNRFFALFTLFIALWIFGIAGVFFFKTLFWSHLIYFSAVWMLFFLSAFSAVFPLSKTLPRSFYVNTLPAIAVTILIPFGLLASDIQVLPSGVPTPKGEPGLIAFIAAMLYYATISAIALWKNYHTSKPRERMRVTYFVSGVAFLIAVGLITNTILPYLGIFDFNLVGPIASIGFVATTTYAVVRHQLLDMRIIIQRSLIYSILLGCIVSLYIALLQILRHAFGPYDETVTLISTVGTTILGIFSAPYIERFFRKITDQFFFKDAYSYADALQALSEVLHRNITFDDLVRESEETLGAILKTASVTIVLNPYAENGADHVVPLTLDGKRIGYIQLGEKLSGDPYNPQDLQLLDTFAYQAATALSRAQLFADAQDQAAVLERKVEERTRELSETRAREQQMLNDLSHNLQTPLTILQTRLDALKRLLPNNRDISSFEQSLSGFSGFVYDLLALARLEGGRQSVHLRLSLSDLLIDIAEEIDVIASADDIGFHADIEQDIFVHGDERRLRELILNLASNALKYMHPTGTKEMHIQARKSGSWAEVRITDTGMGIAPEDLPRVFDRFYRGKDTPRERKGTGLGLSIAKSIVEHHHGSIHIESVNREGTTVEIKLPLAETA